MFRLFGCNGATGTDIIIEGILMAYDSGADVINLSLGEYSNWGDGDLEEEIINKVVSKGVHMVFSAGNAGDNGISTVGKPSTASKGFSIASIENAYHTIRTFSASGIKDPITYLPGGDDTAVDNEVVMSDKTGAADDSCTPDQVSPNVKGKIALIQRGSCYFEDKAVNAKNAGAVGVIFYNNIPGEEILISVTAKIPVLSISNADGLTLAAAIKKGTVKLTFNHKDEVAPANLGGTVSDFSSLGADAELNFKPQIAGVGGNIYSTLPRFLGGWGIMSVSKRSIKKQFCAYIK